MSESIAWLTDLWSQITSAQEAPLPWMILVSWALSLTLVFTPLWRLTRNAITVVHEGGHALMAILWGRRISGIKLHSDTSGVTISRGNPRGLGSIFTAASGYTAPAFLGLAMQWLSSTGHSTLGLAILALALLLIFIAIRNLWGIIVVVPLLVGFYYVLQFEPLAQVFMLLLIATFLTVASLKPIIELHKARRRGTESTTDADMLAQLTVIVPGVIWVGFFFLTSLIANLLAIYLQVKPLISPL